MHALLFAGAALVGLPILLHLIMKQEPKRLPFPAFRFLRQKLKTNQRKLRLRHFLLLAMRMLLIALFCLALYQPTLLSDKLNISGQQPVAVVIVIDTSPSMGYTDSGKTRLEEAKRRALELLDELPETSPVAVVETGDPTAAHWLPSRTEARKRINEIKEPRGGGQPVTSAIGTAYQLLRTVEQEAETAEALPRLVAVFTDRTAASWDATRVEDLKKLRDGTPDPKPIHALVDVGVEQPANVAILSAEMKPQVVPANQPAVVTVTVAAAGPDVDAEVRAKLDDGGTPESKAVTIPGGQTRAVTFEFRDLKPGPHRVEFALKTPDKLAFDNVRYFTFRTAEPRKILTIADNPDEAAYWLIAHRKVAEFDCTVVKPDAVKAGDLFQYEVVCMLGVARPALPTPDPLWGKLQKYVEGGGKLVIMPGDRDRVTDDYDFSKTEGATQLMPGKFKDIIDARTEQPAPADPKGRDRREGVIWAMTDPSVLQHPLLAPFREWRLRGNVDFIVAPRKAWKYWDVEKLGNATPIVLYDDNDDPAKRRPAVLEKAVGKGRVLLLTTRMDTPTGERDADWNDYWELTLNSWIVVFPNLLVKYLAGDTADANFNHRTGQTITVPLPRAGGAKREDIAIDGPFTGEDPIIKPAEKQTELKIGPPRTLVAGNFVLQPVGEKPEWAAGFSLNAPPEESQLDKVPVEAIEELTGPMSVFPVGRDAKLRDLLTGPVIKHPVDLFPWLLIAVLLLLAVEGLVANRFYRRKR